MKWSQALEWSHGVEWSGVWNVVLERKWVRRVKVIRRLECNFDIVPLD